MKEEETFLNSSGYVYKKIVPQKLNAWKKGNDIFIHLFMKVRIQGNSIRFRLKQPEVERFGREGSITESMSFTETEDGLSFTLEVTQDDAFSVQYDTGKMILWIPQKTATQWTRGDAVGFEEKIKTSAGKTISLLVEKDFKCLDGKEEEEEGSYPNPLKAC